MLGRDDAIIHARRYAIVAVIGGVDQLTKQVALNALFYPPQVIDLLPFLRFVPVWNKGMSFGLLGDAGAWAPVFLTVLALGVAAILPFAARNWDKMSIFGALLMAGGALGNAIDRMIYGKVIDFIDVFAGQWHWPAFNVADMAVCVGAGLMMLAIIQDSWNGRGDQPTKGE